MKELMKVSDNNTNEIETVMFSNIKHKINKIDSEINVNNKVRNIIENKIAEREIVDKYEYGYNVSKIDLVKELDYFYKSQNSVHTSNTYRNHINKLIDYCNENKIELLKITPGDVDSYMTKLNSEFSPRSVRGNIMSCNSLFKSLIYKYPDCFKLNPFRDRKLPKDTDTRRKDFCSISDINELKNEFKRIERYDIITVIDLMTKYGFRVGLFNNITIDDNGYWNSDSKGKDYKGKFTKNECDKIKKYGVLNLTISTIKVTILKYTKKLFDKGIISCPFSVHDLRRLYIHLNVKNYKNGEELVKFSKTIHKHINTTIGYL
jgi:hypothetical protein